MVLLPQHVRIAAVSALVLAAPHAGAQTRAGARASHARVAGSYAIAVCPSGCGSGGPAVHGVLVLFPGRMPVVKQPSAAARALKKPATLDGDVNACFAFAPLAGESQTLAGVRPVGADAWDVRADGLVHMALFASADAFHLAALRIRGDTVRGTGRSVGMVGGLREHVDSIVGHRIGPADVQRCVHAVESGEPDTTSVETRQVALRQRAAVPGTYRIRICPTGCNPAHPPVTGYLVLLRDTVRTASLPPDVLDAMSLLEIGRPEVTNACFAFDHVVRPVTTLAGIQRAGITGWEHARADSLVVELYASPDAGYHVTFVLRRGTLRGTGPSRGAGVMAASDDELPDRVTGYRMSPPEPGICFRAGQREVARLRAKRAAVH